MTRKNKLYKHHKSKSVFYIKNFSFAFLALAGLGVALSVPTYIASQNAAEISTKAESNKENKDTDDDVLEENKEEEELLHY